MRQQGADHVIGHGEFDRLPERGVDVIVEMLANVNLPGDMKAVAANGRVVVVGSRGGVTVDARDLMGKQAAVVGMNYWSGGDRAVRRAFAAIGHGAGGGRPRARNPRRVRVGRLPGGVA